MGLDSFSCADCDASERQADAIGRSCSKACYMRGWHSRRTAKRREEWTPTVSDCPVCSAQWCLLFGATPRMYCSAVCKERQKDARRLLPQRELVCYCGEPFRSARQDARFCSIGCSRKWQRDNAPRECATSGCDRPLRAKGMCNYCYRKARGEKAQWNDTRRDAYHRRRALKAATSTGAPVRLADIASRDGNKCHLCRKAVSKRAYPHPLSASLDHVVPLSKGGSHTLENVRLAHLRCNVSKGSGGGNEQLLLIG